MPSPTDYARWISKAVRCPTSIHRAVTLELFSHYHSLLLHSIIFPVFIAQFLYVEWAYELIADGSLRAWPLETLLAAAYLWIVLSAMTAGRGLWLLTKLNGDLDRLIAFGHTVRTVTILQALGALCIAVVAKYSYYADLVVFCFSFFIAVPCYVGIMSNIAMKSLSGKKTE